MYVVIVINIPPQNVSIMANFGDHFVNSAEVVASYTPYITIPNKKALYNDCFLLMIK